MTLLLAFCAGLLSVLSPCVLPLAPVVMASAQARDPRGPLALALGLALAFALGGSLLAASGLLLVAGAAARKASAVLLVAAGLVLLLPPLRRRAEAALSAFTRGGDSLSGRLPAAGLWGCFFAGVALAFAWAPCVGPLLGAAFALAASRESIPAAAATMFAFALGTGLALVLSGFVLRRFFARRRSGALWVAEAGRTALGVVLVVVGAAILTGFDRVFEAAALDASPAWLVDLSTKF
ncbi:cytochrome c biogenesis protein CcdA [Methylocella sp.]|uniref:urease accessory protein UreH domain-containing protein n=1 Tax=Methylocella sp. TaxID=1978226 RepID=UPI0035AE3A2C